MAHDNGRKLVFQLTGAFAEFERTMIRQRIKAGLKRAVAPGREARPAEDRWRDRTEGAKAACERRGHLEGGEVARARDWHGPSHLKRAWLKALTAILPLSPSFLCVAPRVGGLFGFKFSSRRHPRKFGQKRFLAVRRSWRGNGVACFWATSLEEIIGGVIAIISFRPGGWMQQSAVPRCAILSVGAREASGSERPRSS